MTDSKAVDVFANSDAERKYSAESAVQCHKIRSHMVLHIKTKSITGLSFTTCTKKTLKKCNCQKMKRQACKFTS